jgi:hypothetical protein
MRVRGRPFRVDAPTELADFRAMKFENVPPPEWATRW